MAVSGVWQGHANFSQMVEEAHFTDLFNAQASEQRSVQMIELLRSSHWMFHFSSKTGIEEVDALHMTSIKFLSDVSFLLSDSSGADAFPEAEAIAMYQVDERLSLCLSEITMDKTKKDAFGFHFQSSQIRLAGTVNKVRARLKEEGCDSNARKTNKKAVCDHWCVVWRFETNKVIVSTFDKERTKSQVPRFRFCCVG